MVPTVATAPARTAPARTTPATTTPATTTPATTTPATTTPATTTPATTTPATTTPATTTPVQGYANDEVLVEPLWLQDHLQDRRLHLVEVDVSPAAYDLGHIKGAVLWNVYRDLKDANYQLVDKAAVERLVTGSGIDADSTVVFYGYAPAMGFWLMKLFGHADVRILNCSRSAWEQAGRPWTADVPTPLTTRYRLPDQDDQIRAGHGRVAEVIQDPSCTLLDVRTDPEFRGERFWPSGGMEQGGRAGHVPSARHQSIEGLIDEQGSFGSAERVRSLFTVIDPTGDGEVIPYCTIGGRACTTWFALTYLIGRRNVRVYDGSWAEWGRMPAAPVESAVSP
jgi:thiosulfate/3-mercaptopyruvate sulfurtransferase